MFGWILKTGWDIDYMMGWYRKRNGRMSHRKI